VARSYRDVPTLLPTPIDQWVDQRVDQLTEATAIDLVRSLQRQDILTPLSPHPIATAFVHPELPGRADAADCGELPVVLLPGFDSSVLEFRRLLPLLAQHYPTWAIDLLGFGFSDRPTDIDFSPAAIKTHLYHTWKTLIDKPMVLVGASMGGAAAIDFALTYPEAVAQLVLMDAAGFAKGPAASKLLAVFPGLGPLATNFLRRPQVRAQVSRQAYFDPQRWVTPDAECCTSLHLAMPRWREALISFTRSGGYNFLSDKIVQITVPTLMIWGRQDKILGTQDALRFKQAIADSQLVWIEQCGHVPHLEQSVQTAAAIGQFVG
jgi:pimeloyl-ACP methyl ester carboxylesterase